MNSRSGVELDTSTVLRLERKAKQVSNYYTFCGLISAGVAPRLSCPNVVTGLDAKLFHRILLRESFRYTNQAKRLFLRTLGLYDGPKPMSL
jgi:hypothetical protein